MCDQMHGALLNDEDKARLYARSAELDEKAMRLKERAEMSSDDVAVDPSSLRLL